MDAEWRWNEGSVSATTVRRMDQLVRSAERLAAASVTSVTLRDGRRCRQVQRERLILMCRERRSA
jgi:hypothetical protein